MTAMKPVAFDIETTGLEGEAMITVVGLDFGDKTWACLNTNERYVDEDEVQEAVQAEIDENVYILTVRNEYGLLDALCNCVNLHLDPDEQYLAAFNGETWNGGFDLPFLRRRCIEQDMVWMFDNTAYCDIMQVYNRINTDADDLVGVYNEMIGEESCDPFDDSEEALTAYENGDFVDLILHNVADVQRTRELAVVASKFVPRSDFKMKSLDPPMSA